MSKIIQSRNMKSEFMVFVKAAKFDTDTHKIISPDIRSNSDEFLATQ